MNNNEETKTVLLAIDDNRGYVPDQIETSYTLGELLEDLEDAIKDYGPDAVIVLSNGQRYGAGYGRIRASAWGNPFGTPEDEADNLL